MRTIIYFLSFLFICTFAYSEESDRDFALNIKDALPNKHQILWQGGYDEEEAEQIKESSNYNKIRMLQDPYPNSYIKTIDGKKLKLKLVELE